MIEFLEASHARTLDFAWDARPSCGNSSVVSFPTPLVVDWMASSLCSELSSFSSLWSSFGSKESNVSNVTSFVLIFAFADGVPVDVQRESKETSLVAWTASGS
ncbi:hypothetical protein PC118_g19796 [Phytophthora cactorum]|uniref:Uncharacterized protein n=1 Tax=Phytophthora cactorum TaxID=29920 RepID=A0A8T0YD02_9STRA|nr:hypothetical protein PC112_g20114 [Phytophthora cactorum]KAG2810935.1 hypothetical protein PC111_g15435 [Phytophthora cactorum]KAG2836641.1 hypothetical protein PC113_g19992 [Phytophthora cactorum]KAG2965361.1 hypothetical protein PC118_g19796 [Phytophthora cactorum]KAG2979119.1 hypothetical protein PC119_g21580 [Phytophthora cactorum]